MTDLNDVDRILSRAKNEAESFFADYSSEQMSKSVFTKIQGANKLSNYNNSKIHSIIRKIKIPAITVCSFFILIGLSMLFLNGYYNQKEVDNLGEPVSQELIRLNESKSIQLLDYFIINKPKQTGDNLLAVIWDSEHDGHYEMVYSSLFEDSNEPGPILMIYFPPEQPDMVVISSENKDLDYIHYRVVGYKKNQIVTLMEQNYIDRGEIEVSDGVLKETRFIPGHSEKIVTHYIPYQLNEFGDIISSMKNIKMNTGEYLAFIGNTSDPIEVMYSDLFSEFECELIDRCNENKVLYAEKSGHEELSIMTANGGKRETISVEVAEE